jgi:hypothetical protein
LHNHHTDVKQNTQNCNRYHTKSSIIPHLKIGHELSELVEVIGYQQDEAFIQEIHPILSLAGQCLREPLNRHHYQGLEVHLKYTQYWGLKLVHNHVGKPKLPQESGNVVN